MTDAELIQAQADVAGAYRAVADVCEACATMSPLDPDFSTDEIAEDFIKRKILALTPADARRAEELLVARAVLEEAEKWHHKLEWLIRNLSDTIRHSPLFEKPQNELETKQEALLSDVLNWADLNSDVNRARVKALEAEGRKS